MSTALARSTPCPPVRSSPPGRPGPGRVAVAALSLAVLLAAGAWSPVEAGKTIRTYPAKFTCLEALPAGTVYYGSVPPVVREQTDIVVQNPHRYTVTFYVRGVLAAPDPAPTPPPGAWGARTLDPGEALRLGCDSVAQLLTGNPAATFIGTYGIGVEIQGLVEVGIGPHGTRHPRLNVTVERRRGSEVLKKDLSFQPWWRWWWWSLPWQLGYPYTRVLPISGSDNIDCRDSLYTALDQDVLGTLAEPQKTATRNALVTGLTLYRGPSVPPSAEPALVALIGGCEVVDTTSIAVQYVLVSNRASTDPSPLGGGTPLAYPWVPGTWYDLSVAMPQNVSVDLDGFLRTWASQRWIDSGASPSTVQTAMAYYFPWWCGTAFWWGWGGSAGSCTDIGVGEGESLEVFQVDEVKFTVPTWPPA